MAFSGINFRASSGYVTDGANDTYCLVTGTVDAYPTTRGGKTFGANATYEWDVRDWTTGNDPRLAGVMLSTGSGQIFKFDLPSGAGTYDFRIALGSYNTGATWTALIKDGGTTLLTVTGTTSANEFLDATSTVRTAAAWPGSNATTALTFSGTQLSVVSTAGACYIAHIAVQASGGGSSGLPRLAGKQMTGGFSDLSGGTA